MKLLAMLFSLVAAAVVQALLPAWGWFGHAKAPVLLGLVVYYALTRSRGWMLAAAVGAGMLQDGLGMIPLGYSACLFCLLGLVVQRYRDELYGFGVVTHVVIGCLGAGAVALGLAVLLAKDGLVVWAPAWVLSKIAGAAGLGALSAPLVFRLVERLDLTLGNLEESA
jgi:hypothetical protein